MQNNYKKKQKTNLFITKSNLWTIAFLIIQSVPKMTSVYKNIIMSDLSCFLFQFYFRTYINREITPGKFTTEKKDKIMEFYFRFNQSI